MRTYNLNVLGHQVSFKAEAEPHRVEKAQLLLDERYSHFKEQGSQLSQERILVFLALALADDLLEAQEKLEKVEQRLKDFVLRLDNDSPPAE